MLTQGFLVEANRGIEEHKKQTQRGRGRGKPMQWFHQGKGGFRNHRFLRRKEERCN
jgi:hypothetical protein